MSKSCSELIEELISQSKKQCLTLDEYIIEFSRLVGKFIDKKAGGKSE